MSRFDSVKYDADAMRYQEDFRAIFICLEEAIGKCLDSPRSKALALTRLEEALMWVNKAIRDDQIERTGKIE